MPKLRKNANRGESLQGAGLSADKTMRGMGLSTVEASDLNISYRENPGDPLEHSAKTGENAHGFHPRKMGSKSAKFRIQTVLSGGRRICDQKRTPLSTCVMDLARGDILWVGKGRTIKDFRGFFDAFSGTDNLSCVKAVAMDMNASYNALVKEYLPQAEIVYDRYHVQALFGRDVLGKVRLDAARSHKEAAKKMGADGESRQQIQQEKKLYSKVKKARWVLLQNNENLRQEKQQSLNEILDTHSDLAVCYAMKEELCALFQISDPNEARHRWSKWFDAAINSNIPALAKFGRQKLRRLDGLVAHAAFPINTDKLEGFNNKIKVAKCNAYGFRNLGFFFSYIRFLSLPSSFVHPNL